MCSLCWEAYAAGYMTRTEVWQCVYYLDIIRSHRDELRRIPKREPDDPYYRLQYGEGLLPYIFNREEEEFYLEEIYRYVRRRKIYRMMASGEGAGAPEERAARGDVLSLQGTAKITEY